VATGSQGESLSFHSTAPASTGVSCSLTYFWTCSANWTGAPDSRAAKSSARRPGSSDGEAAAGPGAVLLRGLRRNRTRAASPHNMAPRLQYDSRARLADGRLACLRLSTRRLVSAGPNSASSHGCTSWGGPAPIWATATNWSALRAWETG
jgi:hypothetical protein